YVVIRTRFLDDFVVSAVRQDLRQVVILAAGMDTRAFRLPWPEGVTLFEIDQPELLKVKDEILRGEGAKPLCRRVAIGANLQTDWTGPLADAGFVPGAPSLWLAEGLFFYLEDSALRSILEKLSSLALSGSRLGCDFVSQS